MPQGCACCVISPNQNSHSLNKTLPLPFPLSGQGIVKKKLLIAIRKLDQAWGVYPDWINANNGALQYLVLENLDPVYVHHATT